MTGWGGGYVTDVAYMAGYYAAQSPAHLHLTCVMNGYAGLPARSRRTLSYMELGSGLGLNALVHAASNPDWTVTAIDFNPAHIALAREIAAEAGVANLRLIEADLATLAESPLAAEIPEADVVTAHGVWSWVPLPVREGIVRLLRAKLRSGGLLHLSYNALPGWQGALGMQRVLREAGLRLGTRSDRQAVAGIGFARELRDAGAIGLAGDTIGTVLTKIQEMQPEYLAHEYMNASWSPCFHADVAAALAEARLDWVASANLIENFAALNLTEEQRALRDRFDDPIARELVRDLCLPRVLRHDVFVRGARRLDPAARDAALADAVLMPLRTPDMMDWELTVPIGTVNLPEDMFGPVVRALGQGPCRLGDLATLPDLPRPHANLTELAGMLHAVSQVIPAFGMPAPPTEAARRLNQALERHLARADTLSQGAALATGGLGTPMPCRMSEMVVLNRIREAGDGADLRDAAADLGAGQDEAWREQLQALFESLAKQRAPVWRLARMID